MSERDWVDDRHTDHDPHDIVPADFCRAWGEPTIPRALAAAERAPSSTPAGEFRRCPDCESVKIYAKPGWTNQPNRRPEPLKCGECGAHFDEPAAPADDAQPGRQVRLDEGFLA